MSAGAIIVPFAYLHPGDLTPSELIVVLLVWLAALALPFVLIGVFVWFVARPKGKVLSIQKSDADGGRE